MATSLSFTIDSEFVMTEEHEFVSLTKELNIWQKLQTSCMSNVKLNHIEFVYTSRVSDIASGTITASVIDNSISDDGFSDNVLKTTKFDIRDDVILQFSHNVSFHVRDIRGGDAAPILLRLEVTDSNIKPGISLGNMKIKVELGLSNRILKRITGKARARITQRKLSKDDSTAFPLVGRPSAPPTIVRSLTMPRKEKKYVYANPSD